MNLAGFRLRYFTMLKRGLPLALCCIPMVVAGVLAVAGAFLLKNGRVSTMDVNTIFVLVMGLACPIGMGLMMWLMHKHTSQPQAPLSPENYQKSIGTAKCLAALHEQRRVLDAEITAQSQGIEMEEQSRQVVSEPSSVPEDMPISVAH